MFYAIFSSILHSLCLTGNRYVHKHLVPYNLSGMTPDGTHLPIGHTYLNDRCINTADVGMPAHEGQQCADPCR